MSSAPTQKMSSFLDCRKSHFSSLAYVCYVPATERSGLMSAFGAMALSGCSPRRPGSDAEFTFVSFIGSLCHLSFALLRSSIQSRKQRGSSGRRGYTVRDEGFLFQL